MRCVWRLYKTRPVSDDTLVQHQNRLVIWICTVCWRQTGDSQLVRGSMKLTYKYVMVTLVDKLQASKEFRHVIIAVGRNTKQCTAF